MSDDDSQPAEERDIVTYSAADGIAWIAMNRPKYNNAQNGRMTYELDGAFKRAVADDEVKVIVLRGEGKHFSKRCVELRIIIYYTFLDFSEPLGTVSLTNNSAILS